MNIVKLVHLRVVDDASHIKAIQVGADITRNNTEHVIGNLSVNDAEDVFDVLNTEGGWFIDSNWAFRTPLDKIVGSCPLDVQLAIGFDSVDNVIAFIAADSALMGALPKPDVFTTIEELVKFWMTELPQNRIYMFNPRLHGKTRIRSASVAPALTLRDIEIKPPSLLEQATNFRSALHAWAKDGFAIVPEPIFKAREIVCSKCDSWDQDAFMGTGRCLQCGCSKAKLWLAVSECPLGKWAKMAHGVKLGNDTSSGAKMVENMTKILEVLSPNSAARDIFKVYTDSVNKEGGCSGCRKRRMLRWLETEIAKLPEDEKDVIKKFTT